MPSLYGNGNSGVWKLVASTMAAMLATGTGFWFTAGVNTVDRSEMRSYIDRHSPWLKDRRDVMRRLSETQEGVREINKSMQTVLVEQAKIIQRLKDLKKNNESGDD